MSTVPFVLRRARTATRSTAASSAADRSDGLARKVAGYVLVTVIGPAAGVLGLAELLPG